MANGNKMTAPKSFSFITLHSALCALICLAFAGCEREERGFRVDPPSSGRVNTIRLSELAPGNKPPPMRTVNEYEQNAFAVSEGARLYQWYNCVGCHAHGGGGMGPPLMDEKWLYGSDPAQIFATIVEGRPNGMPSFRGKVPDHQVWQLVAYVRSMSGQVPKGASPGREDNMSTKKPEQSTEEKPPTNSGGVPKSAEMPQ
ncbi:MAG TPA: cytochrome c [Pyrinomonadaceae bacterium]|nr:cytochrome c [Pyrinomonadaceae bacterium]